MYKLYHQPLCPFSRKVRFLLAGKGLNFELEKENFWERRKEFISMNTAGTLPVLFDNSNGSVVCGSSVIVEYIEEKHGESKSFIGGSLSERAESRRLQSWFDEKFYSEVSKYILDERFFNRFLTNSPPPSSDNLRAAKFNLDIHMNYIGFLLENRRYLAGNEISIADFSAAGHISAIDYFGDINWRHYDMVKEWYCLIKSQKCFSAVLKDRIPHVSPPEHYSKLDF